MWGEQYEKLSTYEKGEFRRLGNYLLSHTYMVRFTYDPGEETTLPNADYKTGWRLSKDDDYGIVSLISEYDNNRYRLDKFTTLFLYVCRLIYEENRENENSYHVVKTDTSSVVEKMKTLGLLRGGKSTQKERIDAQRALAHFNIIQKMTTSPWSGEGNDILILPSILNIISNQSINTMKAQLDELKLSEDSEDENTEKAAAD